MYVGGQPILIELRQLLPDIHYKLGVMKAIQILLIDDNDGDVLLIKEAFEDAKIKNLISTVNNGEKAIHYLEKNGDYKNVTLPDLILLDVNLPRIDGHEVLAYVKNNPDLQHIPVIMLTTSSAEIEIIESYQNHANGYITKPLKVDDFMGAILEIKNFGIQLVKLPSKQ